MPSSGEISICVVYMYVNIRTQIFTASLFSGANGIVCGNSEWVCSQHGPLLLVCCHLIQRCLLLRWKDYRAFLKTCGMLPIMRKRIVTDLRLEARVIMWPGRSQNERAGQPEKLWMKEKRPRQEITFESTGQWWWPLLSVQGSISDLCSVIFFKEIKEFQCNVRLGRGAAIAWPSGDLFIFWSSLSSSVDWEGKWFHLQRAVKTK